MTLKNGLKIIVKIDKRAPVFISQLWYKVGSGNENRPLTGVSHMLEHMMFKGTKDYHFFQSTLKPSNNKTIKA
jgi:zinc protease